MADVMKLHLLSRRGKGKIAAPLTDILPVRSSRAEERTCVGGPPSALILAERQLRRFLSPLRGSLRHCFRNPRLKPWAIVVRPDGTLETAFVRETRVIRGSTGNGSQTTNLLERIKMHREPKSRRDARK